MQPIPRFRNKALVPLLAACLAGCLSGPENARPGDPPPGQGSQAPLVLKLAKGLSKRAAGTAEPNPGTDFFLDTAAGSFFQYFFVENRSDKTIHDIRIRTASRQLQFLPAQIASLEPSASVNFEQILKLAVIHGTRLNAFGYDSVLPKGMNRIGGLIEYSLPGANGDTVHWSLPFTLSVYAKLVDVDLVIGGKPVDLTRPFGRMLNDLSPEPIPLYAGDGQPVSLRNTGNVDLKVKVWDTNGLALLGENTLAPGDSLSLAAEANLEIDGGGVTSDLRKLPVTEKGEYFLGIILPPGNDPPPDPKL